MTFNVLTPSLFVRNCEALYRTQSCMVCTSGTRSRLKMTSVKPVILLIFDLYLNLMRKSLTTFSNVCAAGVSRCTEAWRH